MNISVSSIVVTALLLISGLTLLLIPVSSGKVAKFAGDEYIALVENLEPKYEADIKDNMVQVVLSNQFAKQYKLVKDSLVDLQKKYQHQADSLFKKRKADEGREMEIQAKRMDTVMTKMYGDMQTIMYAKDTMELKKIAAAIKDTLPMEKYYAKLVSSKLKKAYTWEDFEDRKVQKQDSFPFLLGGLSLILIAIIYFLYALKKLPLNQVGVMAGISFVLLAFAAFTGKEMFAGVQKTVDFNNISRERELDVRERLVTIRDAQKQFKKYNDKFAGSFAELNKWLKEDSVEQKKLIQQDTLTIETVTLVPAIDVVFPADEYGDLDLNELSKVPHTDTCHFVMKAAKVERNGVMVPVFEVSTLKINFLRDIALDNFDEDQVIKVGDLTKPSFNGNWGE